MSGCYPGVLRSSRSGGAYMERKIIILLGVAAIYLTVTVIGKLIL